MASGEEIALADIELEATAAAAPSRQANALPKTYKDFAGRFYADNSPENLKFRRGPLPGPLLKQIWGDGDSERALSVWVMILRFMGDLPPSPEKHLTNLQLVQVIITVAQNRPQTRDEIYCQVCKQLTDNPSKVSHARGWILLGLLSFFVQPTDAFRPVLNNFIANGPPLYRPYIQKILARIKKSPPRKRPLTALEVHSAFTKGPIALEVNFFIGKKVVECDTVTTAAEVVKELLTVPDIEPEAGFSLCICSKAMDQVTSISSGSLHVMDAVFEYEHTHEGECSVPPDWQDIVDVHPWTAVYRKEHFAPWWEGEHNLDIIYMQILDGLRRSILRCDNPDAMACLIAQRYYIRCGHIMKADTLRQQIRNEPMAGMHLCTNDEWVRSSLKLFFERGFNKEQYSTVDVKSDVVAYAKKNWFMEFSRRFPDLDVECGSVTCDCALVLLNSRGIFVIDVEASNGQPQLKFEIPYEQLISVGSCDRSDVDDEDSETFSLTMVINGGVVFSFMGSQAPNLRKIIAFYHKGLQERSRYAIAKSAFVDSGDTTLSVEKGELLLLSVPWSELGSNEWMFCVCDANHKKQGMVRSSVLYALPRLGRPENAYVKAHQTFFS